MKCDHPARALQNPRRVGWTGGPDKRFVADCADCGAIALLDAPQDARKDRPDVLHGGPRGPLVESVMAPRYHPRQAEVVQFRRLLLER